MGLHGPSLRVDSTGFDHVVAGYIVRDHRRLATGWLDGAVNPGGGTDGLEV